MLKSWQSKLKKQREKESRGTSTRLVCEKKGGSKNVPIRCKQGHLHTSEKDQKARSVEHFKKVLNKPAPEEEPEIPKAEEDLNTENGPPKLEEIITTIKSVKNHKEPSIDCHNAELFKAVAVAKASILQALFSTIWNSTEEKYLMTVIKASSSGYRSITLLSIPSKILVRS